MNRPTCPFLGMKDAPSIASGVPSDENHCHHVRPVSPVNLDYQQKYCLSAEHRTCPLYLATQPPVMPTAVVTEPEVKERRPLTRQMALLMILPLLLACVATFAFVWNNVRSKANGTEVIPDTGPVLISSVMPGTPIVGTATAFNAVVIEEDGGGGERVEIINCPMPSGFMTYVVNPADSIFRLALVFNLPVEDLLRANCMGNSTAIQPGQLLYVPFVPTSTPLPLQQLTPSGPLATNTVRPRIIWAVPTETNSPSRPRRPDSIPTPIPTTGWSNPIPTQTSQLVLPTSTRPLPSATVPAATSTPRPTNTVQPPTNTSVPPTATQQPQATATTIIEPTNTPRPVWPPPWWPRPSRTPLPTNTPVPPTNTPLPPPTNTPVPPTNTPLPPPTNTPVPPTNTPLPPPTNTPLPPPTQPPDPTNPPAAPTADPLPSPEPVFDIIDTVEETWDSLFGD